MRALIAATSSLRSAAMRADSLSRCCTECTAALQNLRWRVRRWCRSVRSVPGRLRGGRGSSARHGLQPARRCPWDHRFCGRRLRGSLPAGVEVNGDCAECLRTASECTGIPYSAAIAAISGMDCTVPTSLFAHMTVTSATSSGFFSMSSRTVCGLDATVLVYGDPFELRALCLSEPFAGFFHGVVFNGGDEEFSALRVSSGVSSRCPDGEVVRFRCRREVKIISGGSAPTARAMRSRAYSTVARRRILRRAGRRSATVAHLFDHSVDGGGQVRRWWRQWSR